MVVKEAQAILEKIADFLNKNEGNKLNEWLAVPLISTIREDLNKIIASDAKKIKELTADLTEAPDDAVETDKSKQPLTEGEVKGPTKVIKNTNKPTDKPPRPTSPAGETPNV